MIHRRTTRAQDRAAAPALPAALACAECGTPAARAAMTRRMPDGPWRCLDCARELASRCSWCQAPRLERRALARGRTWRAGYGLCRCYREPAPCAVSVRRLFSVAGIGDPFIALCEPCGWEDEQTRSRASSWRGAQLHVRETARRRATCPYWSATAGGGAPAVRLGRVLGKGR